MESKSVAVLPEISPEERALLLNDLSKLSPEQRSTLYMKVCQSVGLNHLTQPFGYLNLNGKLVLYAQRNCTDQLRTIHNVDLKLTASEKVGDLYVVRAMAKRGDRHDESIGAVSIANLKGNDLANAMMKCETKAKRRVTLSICGLSFMDETEIETVKDARIVSETPKSSPQSPQSFPQDQIPLDQPPKDYENIPDFFEDEFEKNQRAVDYQIPFTGNFKNRPLGSLTPETLKRYRDQVNSHPYYKNPALKVQVDEFLENSAIYLKSFGL